MLVCGGDLLQSFLVPNLWSKEDLDEILSEYGLVVVKRSGVDTEARIYESPILHQHKESIHLIEDIVNPNDCSSTKIRAALRRGDSIRYLVDEDVYAYIMVAILALTSHAITPHRRSTLSTATTTVAVSTSASAAAPLLATLRITYHCRNCPLLNEGSRLFLCAACCLCMLHAALKMQTKQNESLRLRMWWLRQHFTGSCLQQLQRFVDKHLTRGHVQYG